MKNSEEMTNSSHAMDANDDDLSKSFTLATKPQALTWVEEYSQKPISEAGLSGWAETIKEMIS